ncbi:MAG: DUF4931 domain-containing protein [Candidatus Portnoybacteria bacterium]|nr:DUF4931 domain-containing protein [Candidatus Portnoybacteria bacterium]
MKIVKDYFLDHYTYISEGRAKRPQDFAQPQDSTGHDTACVFCPGSEALTPPEIGRIDDGKGSWKMRWFLNKFPAVSPEDADAYGYHEVIVETPDPQIQLWDFSQSELRELFSVYQERIQTLENDVRVKYVVVFKNHGPEAGASLRHSHTQVIATSAFPSRIERKLNEIKTLGKCPYCKIVQEEKGSERYIMENDEFIAFCPRAPRFSLEAWIVAKEHTLNFSTSPRTTLLNLSSSLGHLLSKLKTINAPYCFYLSSKPKESDLHFHLELLPRLHVWAGFELGTGDYIITIPPEDAAKFYRE